MTTRRRAGAVSIAGLLGLVLAILAAQRLGLDHWNWYTARADAQRQDQEAIAIESQRIQFRREVAAADRITAKLREGQITLTQAIDELEPLMRHRVGFEHAWPYDPPPTFRHAVARYATTRVEAELANDPERRAVVCARLNAEYATLK